MGIESTSLTTIVIIREIDNKCIVDQTFQLEQVSRVSSRIVE